MQILRDFKSWYAENWRGSQVGSWPLFFLTLAWLLIGIGGVVVGLVVIGRGIGRLLAG